MVETLESLPLEVNSVKFHIPLAKGKQKMKKSIKYPEHLVKATANLILVMLAFTVTRIVFLVLNKDSFPGLEVKSLTRIFLGGLRFDLVSVLYLSIPYILLALAPVRARAAKTYRKVQKWMLMIPI